jgi:RNA polymerase sigma-70 factor (ECF subfamily)
LQLHKTNISTLTDEELLLQFRITSDTEYFGVLYDRYIPLVYGLCLKYLQNADKAEDATMQLFENLAKKVKNYEIKVFRTWLYSVAKNHCFQILRKKEREISLNSENLVMESDSILHLFSEDSNNDRLIALNKCIEKLPEPQRISVLKFFIEELSYAEIVDATGYQLKSVKSYIQNGKRNLKICIEKSTVE